MGRSTIIKTSDSPFEVQLADLLALQTLVAKGRSRALKRSLGSPLSMSKIRGRGMDFAETRNYFPGDDIRYMDWRVTARTQKPHVKVFQVERERPVVIINDFAPTMFFGTRHCLKSVLATKFAAMLAWTARSHGDRIGGMLLAPGQQSLWLPHARNQTLIHFLKALSQATASYNNPAWLEASSEVLMARLIKTLRELQTTLKPGSLILFLSDWYYPLENLQSYFLELRQHHDLIIYQIADPFELGPPGPGIFPISNGASILPLNFHESSQFESFSDYCENRQQGIQAWVKKMGLAYHLLTVEQDLIALVQNSLLRRLSG
jgi:uncharacterized protein (DUF58 family)